MDGPCNGARLSSPSIIGSRSRKNSLPSWSGCTGLEVSGDFISFSRDRKSFRGLSAVSPAIVAALRETVRCWIRKAAPENQQDKQTRRAANLLKRRYSFWGRSVRNHFSHAHAAT